MKFSEDDTLASYLIRSYDEHTVTVADTSYQHSLILTPQQAPRLWSVNSFQDINAENLLPLYALEPELLLIGIGTQQQLPSQALLSALVKGQVGYELMTNAAACRSFNLLANDGRRVVLGIILSAG